MGKGKPEKFGLFEHRYVPGSPSVPVRGLEPSVILSVEVIDIDAIASIFCA